MQHSDSSEHSPCCCKARTASSIVIESVRTPEPRVQGQGICLFASRPATKENLRFRNDSSNELPHSFQRQPATSLTLVPTSFALVPHSPPTSLTLVSTSFALVPDSQLTVAIDRGQATTVLSEHHKKEQRKRTQRRSATICAVFLLCVLRARYDLSLDTKGLCVHIDVIVLEAMCNVQVWRVDGQAQTKKEKKMFGVFLHCTAI